MKNRKRMGAIDVQWLRDQGYGVHVEHSTMIGHPNRDRPEYRDRIERRFTRVTVTSVADVELASGVALCRPDEPFDRRLGLTIAAGRARIALVKAGMNGG